MESINEKIKNIIDSDMDENDKALMLLQLQMDNPNEKVKEMAQLYLYSTDIGKYCKECLKIRSKNGEIIALVPNEHQEKIIKLVEDWKKEYPDEKKRPTLFIIILKARQVGFSTIVEAIFFHELNYHKNRVGMVVSYDEESAKNINDMSDRYYKYLPLHIKPLRRPSRGKGLLFENDELESKVKKMKNLGATNEELERIIQEEGGLQSKFLIDTARNKNAGSSYTINYLHISELAKWADAKATLTSLLQAVPQNGGIVVIESTANGIEHFHKLWSEAKRGDLSYHTIFVGWHEHKEYVLPFPDENKRAEFIKSLTQKEIDIKNRFNLSYEQVNWRRDTIKKKCQNDENVFNQEYPHDDLICFLTTGRPVFDRQKIQEWKHKLELKYKNNPYKVGYIEYNSITGKYEFIPDEYGIVKIYEEPKEGYPYVMGGDIAEGLAHGDWSVSPVCDNTTGKIVAKLRCHIHPDLFADEQIKLARYYNEALIANEVNNHGLTTITSLKNQGYYKQYKREIYDKISKTKIQKFGFDTKKQSRKKIINSLRAIVRENIEYIVDIDTLDEMLTFVYKSDGKEEHEEGCHDDCVLSTAIMYEARSQQRGKPPKVDKTVKPNEIEMVHPSVYEDIHRNPSLRENYRKKYELEVAKRHGLNIIPRRNRD